MAKLKAPALSALPKSTFGLPGAANAKVCATQPVNKGKLSAAQAAKIRAKANAILGGISD